MSELEYEVAWTGASWRNVPPPQMACSAALAPRREVFSVRAMPVVDTVYTAFRGQLSTVAHLMARTGLEARPVYRALDRLRKQGRVERLRGPGRSWGREQGAHYRPVTR